MNNDISNFKIMLVDDELELGDICVEILQLNGYSVEYYVNGLEALESVKQLNQVHLLITDINMDSITGPKLFSELYKKIQNIGGTNLPVIFMSGEYDKKVGHLDSHNVGIYYLSKPFQIHDLLNQVSEIYQKYSAPEVGKVS
ncbi:response regulator [bacterium]|nr:response regulator [bacterium]